MEQKCYLLVHNSCDGMFIKVFCKKDDAQKAMADDLFKTIRDIIENKEDKRDIRVLQDNDTVDLFIGDDYDNLYSWGIEENIIR